jgi:hypothetical protein
VNESETSSDSDSNTDDDEVLQQEPGEESMNATGIVYKAKNGRVWSADVPPASRVRACNIRHAREGPLGKGRAIETEIGAFLCFIDVEMLQIIIQNTNKYGQFYMT